MTAAEAIAIIESANVPISPPPDVYCGDVDFGARDQYKVVVFYDCGEFDYVDSIIAPNGDRFDYPFNEFQGPDGNPIMCWYPKHKAP